MLLIVVNAISKQIPKVSGAQLKKTRPNVKYLDPHPINLSLNNIITLNLTFFPLFCPFRIFKIVEVKRTTSNSKMIKVKCLQSNIVQSERVTATHVLFSPCGTVCITKRTPLRSTF